MLSSCLSCQNKIYFPLYFISSLNNLIYLKTGQNQTFIKLKQNPIKRTKSNWVSYLIFQQNIYALKSKKTNNSCNTPLNRVGHNHTYYAALSIPINIIQYSFLKEKNLKKYFICSQYFFKFDIWLNEKYWLLTLPNTSSMFDRRMNGAVFEWLYHLKNVWTNF